MRLLDSTLYNIDLQEAVNSFDMSQFDEKTFFITGGLGLIASTIVDVLLKYDKTGYIYIGARDVKHFQNRYGNLEKVRFVLYDALKPIGFDFSIDYIICGAGLASPELYSSMPVETIVSNINGIHELLSFGMRKTVERILYISSSEVYGNKNTDKPFVEGEYGEIAIDNIRSSYAIAKRASEMMCKAYTSEYGLDTVIVRPGHIYGPSAKKEDKRISSDFAFKAAFGKKMEMKSSGLQKRSYCYSIDCAIQILTVLSKGESGQAYNIGHDEVITIREMAEILANAGNVKLTIEQPSEQELKIFNPMNNSALNNSKIKKLGYRDLFSVNDGLTHTVKILKEVYSDSTVF